MTSPPQIDKSEKLSWRDTLITLFQKRVAVMLLLGFSAGLPILLIFSSLSLWLAEAGISKSTVTMFSWAALGYSFKFVWAPLIDRLPVPLLTPALGRRRAWLLVAQIAVIVSIIGMASVDPLAGTSPLTLMALACVGLGFSSATQDVVIDAYRIESASDDLQALLSSAYIAGYRIGMLVAGAGCLVLASQWGSTADNYDYSAWRSAYLAMAGCMGIGLFATWYCDEPDTQRPIEIARSATDYLRFLCFFALSVIALIAVYALSADTVKSASKHLSEVFDNRALASTLVEAVRLALAIAAAGVMARLCIGLGVVDRPMVQETYIDPVADFFRRYGVAMAWLLLAIIGLYRVSDVVLGVVSNLFYADMGYSKNDIAAAVKTFGLLMTILGGFGGGLLAIRFGVMRILILGGVLAAATNLMFLWLATVGKDPIALYIVVAADNFSAGLASAAFVAFLSSLTNISFTAMQYAIFSSLMLLLPKILGGYSGAMVEGVGYQSFFVITTLMGLPVIALLLFARKRFELGEAERAEGRR